MLKVYKKLFSDLNSDIVYAAWKDCHKISEYLKGKGDLDLYIALKDQEKFESILFRYNFVKVKSKILNFPFVAHYFGYDEETGNICHLNIYYKLMTGASHLKSYELLFNKEMLSQRFKNKLGIYEVSYEIQSKIYTYRHYLKSSSVLGYLLWLREYSGYINEYNYIEKGLVKSSNGFDLKKGNISFEGLNLNKSIFQNFRSKIKVTSIPNLDIKRSKISPIKSLHNILLLILIRIKKEKKVLVDSRGFVISISGVDGSGKSSMVSELENWLSKYLNVKVMHMGIPRPTLLTLPGRFLIGIRGALLGRGIQGEMIENVTKKIVRPGVLYALRYVSLAYERFKTGLKIRRMAIEGNIVFTDRYVGLTIGKMDSPNIGTNWNGLMGLLGKLEYSLYKEIPPSNLVLFLKVSLKKIIERNRKRNKANKETDEEIVYKYNINKHIEFNANKNVIVQSDDSYDIVLKKLKILVWKTLSSG